MDSTEKVKEAYKYYLDLLEGVVGVYYYPKHYYTAYKPYHYFDGERNAKKLLAALFARSNPTVLNNKRFLIKISGLQETKSSYGEFNIIDDAETWIYKSFPYRSYRRINCLKLLDAICRCEDDGKGSKLYLINQNDSFKLKLSYYYRLKKKCRKKQNENS